IGDITLPKVAAGATHVYHIYLIRSTKRNQLQQYLAENGIGTMIHYPVPPHLQKAYQSLGYRKGDFPIAEEIADTCLSLPLWPGMTEEQVTYVTETIARFYQNHRG
ncbi:MAG TPA: DegT/DnrJ/EryC1/StrS family aminotransferase, partial [Ginsengibacter sp.]|nr:DegT/DnrJ/EryC1/StrS family aminotransferase [Ginsengibacter sp.]